MVLFNKSLKRLKVQNLQALLKKMKKSDRCRINTCYPTYLLKGSMLNSFISSKLE